jgi:hypothetical protein
MPYKNIINGHTMHITHTIFKTYLLYSAVLAQRERGRERREERETGPSIVID